MCVGRSGKDQGGLEKDVWGNWEQWVEVWGQNSNGEGRTAGKQGV